MNLSMLRTFSCLCVRQKKFYYKLEDPLSAWKYVYTTILEHQKSKVDNYKIPWNQKSKVRK